MVEPVKSPQNPVDTAMASWRDDMLPVVLLVALVFGLLVVVGGALFSPGYHLAPALVWSLGFCVSGMLLGFLFGIPRTLPPGTINLAAAAAAPGAVQGGAADTPAVDQQAVGQSPATARGAANEINSNLVEVSDWLTKIIVGVGLVELKNLPAGAHSVARFIAPALSVDDKLAVPIAGGMMLYFSVLGFLIGYLLTRIYLAIIIKRADNLVIIQNDPIRLASGNEIQISLRDVTQLQQTAIDGLQETVTKLVLATPKNLAAATAPVAAGLAATPKVRRRILWVDDTPIKNTLLIDQFKLIETDIKQVTSTNQALAELKSGSYDLLITDMARLEDGRRVQNAGVLLIQAVKAIRPELQIVVYCSRTTAKLYGQDAENAGARVVTSSGTTLLATVRRILDATDGPDQPPP